MDDLERAAEIEGRLAEMEIAFSKMAPGSRAAVYLSRELQAFLAEARDHENHWSRVVLQAERLAERLPGLG